MTYFTREIDFSKGTLKINQATIGDVGHVVWDAAIVLSKYIDNLSSKGSFYFKDQHVVELGAGTGLVGLVAGMHGCHVTLTDLPELTTLMEKNIEENQELLDGAVKASVLKWSKDAKIEKDVDLILIADCIYYEESLEPLVMTMKNLCSPQTQIFMSYEERTSEQKIKLQNNFFMLVREHFEIEEIPQHDQDPVYNSEEIHIFKMTSKK